MSISRLITQICLVVPDVRQASTNWAKVLDLPTANIETFFPSNATLQHYTHDVPAAYHDLQVAKYDLGNFILELLQPGQSASPWRDFLDKNGPGVFHFCVQIDDRKEFQVVLTEIGVSLPYHVGYFPGGSYGYVDAKVQLGLELSINTHTSAPEFFQQLLEGKAQPLDDLL